MNEDCGN
ncbi:hypothetical protein E2320_016370, partial [Naja naja]